MHQAHNDEEFLKRTAPVQEPSLGDAASEPVSPTTELSALLSHAGKVAATMDIELEAWMQAAWSAYVDARPGLREHLEEMQMMAQITAMRQRGRVGQA